jgi:hypothetical protein
MAEGKQHVSIVICGHVDAGKSTTTGRLIFELGGIPEREMQKLKDEAQKLGKGSFAFAFYMDRQKDERERGVTIACTTKVRESCRQAIGCRACYGKHDCTRICLPCLPCLDRHGFYCCCEILDLLWYFWRLSLVDLSCFSSKEAMLMRG